MKTLSINDRITLKPLSIEMSGEIREFVIHNYNHLAPWFEWLTPDYSELDTIDFISRSLSKDPIISGFNFAIIVDGKYAGTIGNHGIDQMHNSSSLGYYLGKEYEGKGIMLNSVRVVIHYLYDELKIERLEIRCNVDNLRSRALPERLGFKLEGQLRNAEKVKGVYRDWAVYGMISDEYRKNKETLLKIDI
ncbi:GNAT family protein [soil metagenome]